MNKIKSKLKAIDLTEQFSRLVKYRIPTGIIAIDKAIGGGVPSGKITELYGGWSAGKTRLVLHILVETLKLGGYAILIDREQALESGLCELVGLDIGHERFIYPDPELIESVEDVFDYINTTIDVIRESDPDCFLCIGWDSLAATPTREDLKDLNPDKAPAHIDISKNVNISSARRAKLIGQGIRKLSTKMFRTHSAFVMVNQLRDRLDVLFGSPTTTPGGKAPKFHSSLRLNLNLLKAIRDEQSGEQIGNRVKLTVDKSRIGQPFHEVYFEMRVDKPIDSYSGLLDYLKRHGEIEHKGSGWYYFTDDKENTFREGDFVKAYKEKIKDKKR